MAMVYPNWQGTGPPSDSHKSRLQNPPNPFQNGNGAARAQGVNVTFVSMKRGCPLGRASDQRKGTVEQPRSSVQIALRLLGRSDVEYPSQDELQPLELDRPPCQGS